MTIEDDNWRLLPISQFEEVVSEWDAINREGPNVPFLDHYFFQLLLRAFGGGREVVGVFYSNSIPQVATVLQKQPVRSWQTFQPSQAPLGAWLQRNTEQGARALATLIDCLPGYPISVGVTQQDPDMFPRPASGGAVRTLDYIDTARVNIVGAFTDYWAGRGRNLRRNLSRQRTRLRKAGVPTSLSIIRESREAGQAVGEYGRLESKGWKAAGGTALHPENDQGRFYKDLMEHYCVGGEGIVFQYFFGSDLVASDLCISRDGVMTILKTTFDETRNDVSPAMLMRQEILEFMHNEGTFKRMEFYGRAMEWHMRLASETRTLYHTTLYRFPWIARVADFRRAATSRTARTGMSKRVNSGSIQEFIVI